MGPSSDDNVSLVRFPNGSAWATMHYDDDFGVPDTISDTLFALGQKTDRPQQLMYTYMIGNFLNFGLWKVGRTHVFAQPEEIFVAGPEEEVVNLTRIINAAPMNETVLHDLTAVATGTRWYHFGFGEDSFGPDFIVPTMELLKYEALGRKLLSILPGVRFPDLTVLGKGYGTGGPSLSSYYACIGGQAFMRATFGSIEIVGPENVAGLVADRIGKSENAIPRVYGLPQ